ncbi:MAG: hypothetical protein NUV56_02620 [Candidatus Uhrbacteria bacterium]|nr:hypothetical protein [Candidatus Uhrbacteria bacterium]
MNQGPTMTSPMPNDGRPPNDHVRNALFIVAVIIAALGTLTVVAFERVKNFVADQGDFSYEYSYGISDGEKNDVIYDDGIDGGDSDDDTVNTDPLVIPEYIGYGGVPSPEDGETWLSNEIQVWSDVNPEELCASLVPYVSSDHIAPYGYPTVQAFEEADVQTALFDYLGVADGDRDMAVRTLQYAINPDAQILGVCHGTSTGTFLKVLVGDFAVIYELALNGYGGLWVKTYQPVAGVMDGYQFIPDNGRGEALIHVGYGDAGFIWWSYYRLNSEYMTSELIETCNGGPQFDDEGGYIEDSWELVCNPEYTL